LENARLSRTMPQVRVPVAAPKGSARSLNPNPDSQQRWHEVRFEKMAIDLLRERFWMSADEAKPHSLSRFVSYSATSSLGTISFYWHLMPP
jgi:hypothetical protein